MYNFFTGPPHFDVVEIKGLDAARFLQGQLTCDVESMQDYSQTFGAACNNKGRVIAGFALIKLTGSYHLCTSRGTGDLLIAALRKYLPFYQCTLQTLNAQQGLFALAGTCAETALSQALPDTQVQPGTVIPLPGGWICRLSHYEHGALMVTEAGSQQQNRLLAHEVPERELDSWEAAGMLNGHYPFRPADSEQYTPQELHYDRAGYISFSKGCYTGQEIVARMHYRGKLKKQLYLLSTSSPVDASPVAVVDHSGKQLAVSRIARLLDQQVLLLAELPMELAETRPALFTAAGQALTWGSFVGSSAQ